MQFTLRTIAAVAALISSSAAHMTMHVPLQWAVPGEPLAPLNPSGSDFPCANGYPNETIAATYSAGGTGMLTVQGSAVHGGGSGQMLVTYDFPPTKDSVWRVMQSWEGNHPFYAPGNLPADPTLLHTPIPFAVPAGLPSGRAVVAWSWFNRIGNREMYMKCATVEINGAKSSVSDLNNDPGMLALPTMFRANSGNGCTVLENIDAIAFKNPGKNVVRAPGYTATSIACDDSQPGTEGNNAASPPPAAPVPTTADAAVPTTTAAAVPTTTAAPPAYPGSGDEAGNGNKAEEPTSTAAPAATTAPVAASGTCVEGQIYCHDNGTWSMCGSGYVQNMGAIPAGMQCKDGAFSAAGSKKKSRSIRFSAEHLRRRHH